MRNIIFTGVALMALAAPAVAADFQPDVEQGTVYDWSGFYAGLSTGYALGNSEFKLTDPNVPNFPEWSGEDNDGWVVGGHAGYLFQPLNFAVIGAELDGGYGWLDAEKDIFKGAVNWETNADWFFLAKAKAGVTFDRFLAFGTLGYAGADLGVKGHENCPGQCVGHGGEDSGWANGWTIGAGAEYAITDHFRLGLEWNRIMFNDVKFADKVLGKNIEVSEDADFDLFRVRASVNF